MQNYQGNAANGVRSPAVTTSIVVDGDIGNAANLTAAIRTLADQVAWLQSKVAVLDDLNTFSGTNTFNGAVNVPAPNAAAHAARRADVDAAVSSANTYTNGKLAPPSWVQGTGFSVWWYTKTADGIVYLRGTLSNPTGGPLTDLAVLPEGYRPIVQIPGPPAAPSATIGTDGYIRYTLSSGAGLNITNWSFPAW